MENPLLNSGDTAQQQLQSQSQSNIKQQIIIPSCSYDPKAATNRGSSNKMFQQGRNSGGSIQMASGRGMNTNLHQNRNRNRNYNQNSYQNYQRNRQETANQYQNCNQLNNNDTNGQGHGDSLAANTRSINGSIFYKHFSTYPYAHGNLNSATSVRNIRSWSGLNPQQQQQREQEQEQDQQELEQLELAQQHLDRSSNIEMKTLQTWRSHQLNVSAPSFIPASAASGATPEGRPSQNHHVMPSQSQPQLHSQSQLSSQSPSQSPSPSQSQSFRNHLFQSVLKLLSELNRSVSYPEMIGMLSMRLQRLPVELKRHLPHTLHGAVANGYFRKDGSYYTLLSEMEQKEIMMRNQEAAKRAKELEKEPLSWRMR